jgi:hypothetical protein
MQVAIENLNINLSQGQTALARAFVESLLRMPDAPAEDSAPAQPDANSTTSTTTPPNIGEYWPGQGGIYAGVARGRDSERDYYLILSTEAPEEEFEWQAALDRAKSVSADGHSDFTVPTRFESALLYANLQDQFDTSYWYWTSTQFSENDAWGQDFYHGFQNGYNKVYERRCRFVRRSVL